MSKKYAVFITTLFCAMLALVFAANAITPDKTVSQLEKRELAQRPALTLQGVVSGQFMTDYEEYVADQFVLRDRWVALKSTVEFLSGKRENNGVYLCANQTLIPRFDAPDEEKAARNFGYVDTFAALSGVPVYFSLIPGKVTLWADRLPAGAPTAGEADYLARGGQSAARWIDLNAALEPHKGEEIFYRTDHHWTSLGAYYGYKALVEGMGLAPAPLESFTKTTATADFSGTAASTAGIDWLEPDTIELYVPETAAQVENNFGQGLQSGQLYDLSKLEGSDKYSLFLSGNKPLTILRSNVAPEGAPKLLLIRDSFADSLAPFLCYNFSEIHLIDPRYYKTPMTKYVKENAIDQVLVLYSVDNFVKEGNLFVLGMGAK